MTDGGWPADWDERMAGRDCPLCETLGPRDNDFMAAVGRLPLADVFLERRSAFAGYCVVVWHGPHVAEPADLSPDEAAGYWRDVVDVGRAVQARFEPAKINYFTLGNTVPHLHTHVVPRPWEGDPAPGGPVPWDTLFAELRPEDELVAQAIDLRRLLGIARPPD